VTHAVHEGRATADVLAYWQLKNLSSLADSPNSKLVVPADFAGLMGAAQALAAATRSGGPGAPAADGVAAGGADLPPSDPPRRGRPKAG
jgi:hypothetical protein